VYVVYSAVQWLVGVGTPPHCFWFDTLLAAVQFLLLFLHIVCVHLPGEDESVIYGTKQCFTCKLQKLTRSAQ
jgi:hypothetical protein